MYSIKKNIWLITFVVVLGGALIAMWASAKDSNLQGPPQFGNPDEIVDIPIDETDHVRGSSDAKVTLVEFSDFQCPACAAYRPLVEALSTEFPNDLRIVYKHFPLRTIHAMANKAAQASEAAALQGKFWEMHDKLFENQDAWNKGNEDLFSSYAEELDLDVEKFKADYNSEAVKEAVNADASLSAEIGLNSTPSFYLNNQKITNPTTYEGFKSLIESKINSNE